MQIGRGMGSFAAGCANIWPTKRITCVCTLKESMRGWVQAISATSVMLSWKPSTSSATIDSSVCNRMCIIDSSAQVKRNINIKIHNIFIALFHPDVVAEYAERTLDGKYVCKVCLTHVTHKKYNMRTHLEGKHHMSSGYACDFCSVAVYKTKQEVNQHKRVCANRTQQNFWIKTWFWCPFCHSDLVWSYASRTEDGKLVCSLCTTFVTHKKYNMRTHLEGVHDLTSGYQCDSCYVVKKTQQTLDKHKLVCRSKMA